MVWLNGYNQLPAPKGRGTGLKPTNRFETVSISVDGEYIDEELRREAAERSASGVTLSNELLAEIASERSQVPTRVYRDDSKSILNRVESPDLPMAWTLNPYRGCEHGCVYCYARPGHEYLAMNCGLDFETKIFAKPDAADLLRRALAKPGWQGETISMSGVTDCYQPVERKMKLTRACLEVMHECRQPATIVTKNHLVTRDLDILVAMARWGGAAVAISLTTLDAKLAATMEPRASTPRDRLKAMEELSAAGVPVMVMTAPMIPGVNDRELPALLEAAAAAGAKHAGYVLLRLPWQVKELFLDWLKRELPERAAKVESLLRQTRGGALYKASFETRMKGEGALAENLANTFSVFAKRYGLNQTRLELNHELFRAPALDGQMRLFG